MCLSCPNCRTTKVKKNGHTHYGKQNHRCKSCGRQFVLNNTHTISEMVKGLIEKALKERLSLRATCRIFGVSLTWLQAFSQAIWEKTPRNLGMTERIKKTHQLTERITSVWYSTG